MAYNKNKAETQRINSADVIRSTSIFGTRSLATLTKETVVDSKMYTHNKKQ